MRFSKCPYSLIMMLVFVLFVPMSTFATSHKNSNSKTSPEDRVTWYRVDYDKSVCKATDVAGLINDYDMLNVRYKKKELEVEGKVVRLELILDTTEGHVSQFFVRGKKECESALATYKSQLKQKEEAHYKRYK